MKTAQQLLMDLADPAGEAYKQSLPLNFSLRKRGFFPVGLALIFTSLIVTGQAQLVLGATGGQPFVIHETYEERATNAYPAPKVNHGIVGLDLLIQQGHYPLVQGVFRGTPAANQGLLPGDKILAINGVTTLGKNLTQVDTMISDIPGDRVMLMVQRGERLSQVKLTVVSLENMPSGLRSEFSGLFGNSP